MSRTARCACGLIAVTCDGEPAKVSLCHCGACQKRTGSVFGVAAFYLREAVAATGEAKTFIRGSDNGYDVVFHFCPQCGSTVWWEPARKPELIAVAVGAFADPAFPAPEQSVHEEERHPWVALELG